MGAKEKGSGDDGSGVSEAGGRDSRKAGVEGTQSIRRALAILDTLAQGRDRGLRLVDVSRRTGLNRPTVHRILGVLVEEGVVERNAETRRYAIGEQVRMLALARASRSPLLSAAEPALQRIADKIGDTTFLTVRVGLDTLCVARRTGKFPVQVLVIDVGERRPLGVSNAGLAMLAALDPDEAESIIARNGERFAAYNITPSRVSALVAEVRRQGYVLRQRGLVKGTKVVSVSIPQTAVSPLAAISVAGVDYRLNPGRVGEIAGFLADCAIMIEKTLQGQAKAR